MKTLLIRVTTAPSREGFTMIKVKWMSGRWKKLHLVTRNDADYALCGIGTLNKWEEPSNDLEKCKNCIHAARPEAFEIEP